MAKTKIVKSKKKPGKSPAKAKRSLKKTTSNKTVSLEMKLQKTLAENKKTYAQLAASGQKTVKSLNSKMTASTKTCNKTQEQLKKIDAKLLSKPNAALKKTRISTQKALAKSEAQLKTLHHDLAIGQSYLTQVLAEQEKCQALESVIKDFYQNYRKKAAVPRPKSAAASIQTAKPALKSVKTDSKKADTAPKHSTGRDTPENQSNQTDQSQAVHFQEPEYFTIGS